MDDATRMRIEDGERCLEAALYYLSIGLSVLPLCYPDHVGIRRVSTKHKCSTPGKRPWIEWTLYQDQRPTEDDLRYWWSQLPSSNVGAAMGLVSDCIRVDVDSAAAEEELLRKSSGVLPATWEFTSGRMDRIGRGLLYGIPDGMVLRTTREDFDRKEELRFQAKGAQTVLPPSRHYLGTLYTWTSGHSPRDIPKALAPAWLVAELAAGSDNGRKGKSRQDWQEMMAGVAEGGRNTAMASLIGKILGGLRDVENDSDVWAIWLAMEAVNERNEPPLDEDELHTVFQSILKAEKRSRLERDQSALERHIATSMERSAHQAAAANGNGGPAKDFSDRPDWDLIIVHTAPITYRVRTEFWSKYPAFADRFGYVTVTDKEVFTWAKLCFAVHAAGGPSNVPKIKDWPNKLEELKQTALHLYPPPETRRPLVVLSFVYRYLAHARPLPQSDNGNTKRKPPAKRPFLDDDGLIRFNIPALLAAVTDAKQDFRHGEVLDALDKERGFSEGWFAHARWWKIKPEDLENIAVLTGEVEAPQRHSATAPARLETPPCGALNEEPE